MRYVGSRMKPHGLTAATMPRMNDRLMSACSPRRSSSVDLGSEFVGVECPGLLDDRAVGRDEQRDGKGDRTDTIGQFGELDRAGGRTAHRARRRSVPSPRPSRSCSHRRIARRRRSASTSAKAGSSLAHGGHVENQRLTTSGSPSRSAVVTSLPSASASVTSGNAVPSTGSLPSPSFGKVTTAPGSLSRASRSPDGSSGRWVRANTPTTATAATSEPTRSRGRIFTPSRLPRALRRARSANAIFAFVHRSPHPFASRFRCGGSTKT